jgi:hypothetical protein
MDTRVKIPAHYIPASSLPRIYELGFLPKRLNMLPLRSWYLFLVSDSLLLSEIKIIVLPPSRIIGYLPISDPVKRFESGILTRWFSSLFLYRRKAFFIFHFFRKLNTFGISPRYG